VAENKTRKNDLSVDAFLNQVEDDQKKEDCLVLSKIMQSITGEQARMWGSSIVGFGEYHYVYESGREGDMLSIGFSPRKQNLSIYIMSGFSDYAELMGQLGKHKTGKSCLYIKKLSDVDLDVLTLVLEKSYQFVLDKYHS